MGVMLDEAGLNDGEYDERCSRPDLRWVRKP